MEATKFDRPSADDIMSAKATFALIGSLLAGLILWGGAFALIV